MLSNPFFAENWRKKRNLFATCVCAQEHVLWSHTHLQREDSHISLPGLSCDSIQPLNEKQELDPLQAFSFIESSCLSPPGAGNSWGNLSCSLSQGPLTCTLQNHFADSFLNPCLKLPKRWTYVWKAIRVISRNQMGSRDQIKHHLAPTAYGSAPPLHSSNARYYQLLFLLPIRSAHIS